MTERVEDQLALVRSLRDQNAALEDEIHALKGGGPGGTSGGMDNVDAKIAASEARTDTKFAELRGDLAMRFGDLKADLARKPGTGALIGTAIGIVGLLLAALAFGGGRFDSGMSARSMIEQTQAAQRATDIKQDAKLDEILGRLPRQKPEMHTKAPISPDHR